MEAPDFWDDAEVSQKKMKELKDMKDDMETYQNLVTQMEEMILICNPSLLQLNHLKMFQRILYRFHFLCRRMFPRLFQFFYCIRSIIHRQA